ncbi:unnamed protein product [Peronospora farinosa]|uniref:Aurora kinase n=1 Tax=Peronospora farinosa TaxID=134698 RepID=A0ABN8CGH6_9STRA|nr:unnamed protein product [Peronospora farinosa]
MADSRRLALERWREEKRRQKENDVHATVKASRSTRRAIAHRKARGAPERTRVAKQQREMPVTVARRASRDLQPLASIKELEREQELLFKTSAKVKSDTEIDQTTSTAPMESMEFSTFSTSKKRRRRRSYISPMSNAPSLAGGAQRVRTPTQPLLENESGDDGGMDEDAEETTPDTVSGPRRVSVQMRQNKSKSEEAAGVTPYKTEQEGKEGHGSSREMVSFGSIGAALRVPHDVLRKESENKSDAGLEIPLSPTLQAKKNLHLSLAVPDYDDRANIHVEIPRSEGKLVFPDRVRLDPAQIPTRTSIDRRASRKSFSSRTSLDDPKSVQSVSERLAEKSKWAIDDFVVTKNLGQGKFGNVYLAKEKCTNVSVALKVIFKSPLVHNGDTSNLKREVEIQVRLRHPNVLRMHGYFYDDSCIYLVLEYAPYGELYKELARGKYFSDDMAAHYVAQVIEALNYCHSCNVIHRDIKPENLLLGYNKTIKLADFGWSVHAPSPYNLRKTFCGTPDYLSPEIVMGESYDYRTDSWSLGVLTYELLVGSTPFYCTNQMDMYQRIRLVDYHFPPMPVICDSAKSFIAGLLKRKPNDRMRLEDAFKHPWIHSRHSK